MTDIKLKFEKKGLGKIYKLVEKLYKNETIGENNRDYYLNEFPKLKVGSKKFNSLEQDLKILKKQIIKKYKVLTRNKAFEMVRQLHGQSRKNYIFMDMFKIKEKMKLPDGKILITEKADPKFKKNKKTINLNNIYSPVNFSKVEDYNKYGKKDFKNRLNHHLYQYYGNIDDISVQFYLIPVQKGQKYFHNFKHGMYNCVMSVIKQELNLIESMPKHYDESETIKFNNQFEEIKLELGKKEQQYKETKNEYLKEEIRNILKKYRELKEQYQEEVKKDDGIKTTVKKQKMEPHIFNTTSKESGLICKSDKTTTSDINLKYKLLYKNQIEKLNEQYLENGVSFDDIKTICNTLKINIKIFNKLNKQIFEHIYNNKHKTVSLVVTENDHVVKFNPDFFNMQKKEIVYVPNVKQAFENNKGWKIIQKTGEGEIKYFYDDSFIYKSDTMKDKDFGEYNICNDYDIQQYHFINNNKLTFNKIYEYPNTELFNFIQNSNHNVFEKWFIENIDDDKKIYEKLEKTITKHTIYSKNDEGQIINKQVVDEHVVKFDNKKKIEKIDISSYYCYDSNKNYASYKFNKYYEHYKFLATSKMNFYKINGKFDINKLVSKVGFIQCTNFNITNPVIKSLEYFIDGYTYPTPILQWALDNGCSFDCLTIAYSEFIQDIELSEEAIENKYYNKFFGVMQSQQRTRDIFCSYKNDDELKDILYYCNEDIIEYDENTVKYQFEKMNLSNRSHISSFVLAYALINVLEKIKLIDEKDIVCLKVDCIITKKDYGHIFNISRKLGDFKIEKNEFKMFSNSNLIPCSDIFDNSTLIDFSDAKLNYKKINFISGGAGCGKTTRFLNVFDGSQDERLNNFCVCFPNNNLKEKFGNSYDVFTHTYHSLFFNLKENAKQLTYYTSVVLDESTMISDKDIKIIVEACKQYHINLFIVGDFDYKTKQIFQLNPVKADSFLDYKFSKKNCYYLHLIKNHRQGNDLKFSEYLQSIRGKQNKDVKLDMFKTISFDDAVKQYTINDLVLCPTNEQISLFNSSINTGDSIKIKYNSNFTKDGRFYANNEIEIIEKSKFNKDKMEMANALTCHLCQGLTLSNKIFIVLNNQFEENMLYVCLSRATNADQIVLVKDKLLEKNVKK